MLLYLIFGVISFIVYIKWSQLYWSRRGVPQIPPDFLLGNGRAVWTGKKTLTQVAHERYLTFKSQNSPHGGLYLFLKPLYYVVDPALIKLILQKDFIHFTDHGLFHHPKDILSMNLFNSGGEQWRNLRAKLTPTFTSGKIKMMFETLVEKTNGLENLIEKFAINREPVAIKDVLRRFTTDVIGSCAFGIECNSLENPDNEFRTYGNKIFIPKLHRFWMIALLPWTLLGNLGFKSNGREVSNFFINIVKYTIKTREENNIIRKDFMHLLLQLKNNKLDNKNGESNNKATYNITENEIIAQCFIFFLAGFETSSTAMTFALLELAQSQGIQEKVRAEINAVLERYEGQVTYDAVKEMNYLDKVVNETLRKFPPVPVIPRTCTKDYKIPGTNTVIEKGTGVHIPVWGLHRDADYYPNPEVFDPERFSEENKAKRPDCTFLPFGEGPRMCIGLRFGMLETKVGLISLLRKYRFTLNELTPVPIEIGRGFIISVKGEVWLNVSKISP